MTEICFLKDYMNCSGGSGSDSKFTDTGGERLKTASKNRGDNLHKQLSPDPSVKYKCHRNCLSTYTSKLHIKCYLSKNDEARSQKKLSFSRDCLQFQRTLYVLWKSMFGN